MSNVFSKTQKSDAVRGKDTIYQSYLASGVYDMTVQAMYIKPTSSDGIMVNLAGMILNQEKSFSFYMMDKDGKNYFETKDGKKVIFAGYSTVEDIIHVVCGTSLEEAEVQSKLVNIYSKEAQKKIPTPMDVFVDVSGKTISLAITATKKPKQALVNGVYVDTDEDVTVNEVVKVFTSDGETTNEYNTRMQENPDEPANPVFKNLWLEKYEGKLLDKTKKNKGLPKKSASADASSTPRKKLFD